MTLLSVTNVDKLFGSLKVADDISFDVEQGQALGIIGPNGAGKSTLFNLIAGNVNTDSGMIKFKGADITSSPPMDRATQGIGRSFQIPQPFEKLTVFENLLVAGVFAGKMTESEAAAAGGKILRQTGLIHQANTIAGSLPLLARKRLELARAMATTPKLLLLDEIAGGLTEAECQFLVETIQEIKNKGITIIWIEHVLHALISVVETLLVLNFGKIIAMGKTQEIINSEKVKEIYLGADI